MEKLRIALIQTDIIWENIAGNLAATIEKIKPLHGKCDLVILPEMFSSGFSMNVALLGESVEGSTVSTLHTLAQQCNLAICGSFICAEEGSYFNRGFLIAPNQISFYDKRHLFRMGDEPRYFSEGKERPIFSYKGWKISLQICYDLRFPVWCRNQNNEYDLLIFLANWPIVRQRAWDILLQARAIENQCYVAGVNRIGKDGHELDYQGGSCLINMKGNRIAYASDNEACIIINTISKSELELFRNRFPVWRDADQFEIKL